MYVGDINEQVSVFLYSVGFGFFIGLLYDLIRLVRFKIIKKSSFVFLQDIVFFAVLAPITFCFLLAVNYGRFRFYVLLALLSGFVCYYLTLSRFLLNLIIKICRRIKSVFWLMARVISAPIRLILKPIAKLWLIISKRIKKMPKYSKNKEKNS